MINKKNIFFVRVIESFFRGIRTIDGSPSLAYRMKRTGFRNAIFKELVLNKLLQQLY